jgi:hypothetical protein
MSNNNVDDARLAINKIKMEIDGLNKLNQIKKESATAAGAQESLLKIVEDGNEEFKKEFGRNMSYSEMRARYG